MRSVFPFAYAVSCLIAAHSFAGSATWNLNPTTGDWSTAANWTPATVPDGPSDVATFGLSNGTNLYLPASTTEVASIVFNPGASSFTINADPAITQANLTLTISGAGLANNSGVTQNVTVAPSLNARGGILNFVNVASAGENTVLSVSGSASSEALGGGSINFHDTSTADRATIFVNGALAGNEAHGGELRFDDNATAANASITVNGAVGKRGYAFAGKVTFNDFSSAAEADFVVNPGTGSDGEGGQVVFAGNATAANATFTLNGATKNDSEGPVIGFYDGATAAEGYFTLNAGQLPGQSGGYVVFYGYDFTGQIVSAGAATFIMNGGNGAGSLAGHMAFFQETTASAATLIANTGTNGAEGGKISFLYGGDGGEARIELFGNGTLEVNGFLSPPVTIGSIEGDGLVLLGVSHPKLVIGSNDLSTTFSGTIQENGSLEKIGTGTLSLTGANSYTDGTTISEGTLLVKNSAGSATGTGSVQVSGGLLGGKGIISGTTTVGSGSGAGGSLQPGKGASKPTTLTIQNTLTVKSDGNYTWKLNTKKAKSDQVVAMGVTIEAGAQFNLNTVGNKKLTIGKVFIAISNTATTAISGTFANLADGSTVTVGVNKLQVTYSGGDGNDLTLIVVP